MMIENQNSDCLTWWGLTGNGDKGKFSNDENVPILIVYLPKLSKLNTQDVCESVYINLNFFSSRNKKSDWPSLNQAYYSL